MQPVSMTSVPRENGGGAVIVSAAGDNINDSDDGGNGDWSSASEIQLKNRMSLELTSPNSIPQCRPGTTQIFSKCL